MNNLMMYDGKFMSYDEVALVPTPGASESWKPVPHIDVIEAVSEVVQAHNWLILDENFGLTRALLLRKMLTHPAGGYSRNYSCTAYRKFTPREDSLLWSAETKSPQL